MATGTSTTGFSAFDPVGPVDGGVGEAVATGAGTLHGGARPRWLGRFAKLLALITFCVAVAGGAVTSTDSGLADKQWPTFEGNLLPDFGAMAADRGKLLEHGHRIIAGSAVLGAWVLAGLLFWVRESRRWVRRLAIAAALTGPIPAVFGGLTVLYKLPPWISIVHVSVAMIFLSLIVSVAVALGRGWDDAERDLESVALGGDDAKWLGAMAITVAASVYVQIILGAVPRHAFVGVMPHILWALLLFTLVALMTARVFARHVRLLRVLRPALLVFFLGVLQFALGISAFVSRPAEMGRAATPFHEVIASVHQGAGVLMLVGSVVLLLRAQRYLYFSQAQAATGMEASS